MAPRILYRGPDQFPAKTEVVIIGGGIMGATIALELAERGIPAVLCEKGEIAGEQSSRNMGWVRKMGREAREMPLAIESDRLWNSLNTRVEAETGYHRSGVAYLFDTRAKLDKASALLRQSKEFGIDTRVLSRNEVAEVLPQTSHSWAGALYTKSDGRAEPTMATSAIVAAAQRKGAKVLTYCAARTIETAGGSVRSVVTEHGEIGCEAVVIAGGAWTSLFCKNLDIDFPQLKITATVLRTGPIADGPDLTCAGLGFAMRRTIDGGQIISQHPGEIYDIVPDSFRYLWRFKRVAAAHIGRLHPRLGRRFWTEAGYPKSWKGDDHTPFEMERTLNPKPNMRAVAQLKASMGNYFPSLRDMQVLESWCGMIDVTPDALPVISPVESVPGLHIVSGFSGTGFAMGPGAGKLAADILTGSKPVVDPTPYRLERLTSAEAQLGPMSVGGTP